MGEIKDYLIKTLSTNKPSPLTSLIIIVSIVFISLVVAAVLFGFLPSTGIFESPYGKFGGAAAGFFATFYTLLKEYPKIVGLQDENKKLKKENQELNKKLHEQDHENKVLRKNQELLSQKQDENKKLKKENQELNKKNQELLSQNPIPKSQTYLQFNFDFPDPQSRNFAKKKKNGNYRILKNVDEQPIKEGELSLERDFGYVWVPPIPIESGYLIEMYLIEDDDTTWFIRERPRIPEKLPLSITLSPVKIPSSDK